MATSSKTDRLVCHPTPFTVWCCCCRARRYCSPRPERQQHRGGAFQRPLVARPERPSTLAFHVQGADDPAVVRVQDRHDDLRASVAQRLQVALVGGDVAHQDGGLVVIAVLVNPWATGKTG